MLLITVLNYSRKFSSEISNKGNPTWYVPIIEKNQSKTNKVNVIVNSLRRLVALGTLPLTNNPICQMFSD